MTEKEILHELDMYLSLYYDEYDDDEINFIRNNLYKFYDKGIQIDITSQILVALNLMKDKDNRYKKYFEFLKNRYNLEQNILEVACGRFPALSKYIDEYQKEIKKGTITAYDPKLVTTKYGNIILNKSLFDKKTDLTNISLITAMHPSEATIPIIRIANQNDKDFSILTCSCTHFENENEFFYYKRRLMSWKDYLYKIARNSLSKSRTIDIDYIEGVKTPIISSRKKVKKVK